MSFNYTNFFPYPAVYRGTQVQGQSLTVSSSAVQFAAFSDTTNMIVLDVQNNDVMCTFDGSTPSPTNGHRLYSGSHYTWSRATAAAAKFIRQGSADGVIYASEFQL
jgi:hypothetical protein